MADALTIEGTMVLACPSCGGFLLHEVAAEVIFRDAAEDGPGTRTVCARGAPTVTRVADADIKETRQDLTRISFTCEDCSTGPDGEDDPTKIFTLSIVQHKGNTNFSWE